MFRRVVRGTKCLSLAIIPIPRWVGRHERGIAPLWADVMEREIPAPWDDIMVGDYPSWRGRMLRRRMTSWDGGMLRLRMTSWGGGIGRVPLALTGQNVRHDDNSMARKAYVMVKFSCKTKQNYCGAGGEKAHMSRRSQGSRKVENRTLSFLM